MSMDKAIKDIADALKASKKDTQAYDTKGTVRRVEGNIAWVHFAGGIDETPVDLTINASVGDTVQVRVADGRAWITGNITAPPTDDSGLVQVRKEFKKSLKVIEADIINNINIPTPEPTPGDIEITPDDRVNVFIPRREFSSSFHKVTDSVRAGYHYAGIDLVSTKTYRVDINRDSIYISDPHVYVDYANSRTELTLSKYWFTFNARAEYLSATDNGTLFSTKALATSALNNVITLRPSAYDSTWEFWGPVGLTRGIVRDNVIGTGYVAGAGYWSNAVNFLVHSEVGSSKEYNYVSLLIKPSYISDGWTGITVSYKEL